MNRLFLLFNLAGIFGGGGGVFYIVTRVDPVALGNARIWGVLMLLALVLWSVWSVLALVGFGFRRLFTGVSPRTAWVNSQRQGFLLALLLTLNLFLKGMFLWNAFSAIILVLTIVMVEYYFLQRQYT